MEELRSTTLISWILALILAWFFFQNGWPKLVPAEDITTQFEDWGYSGQFARLIGILECVGALIVLFPRLAFYGSLLLTGLMLGAVYTHLATGIGSPYMAILLLVLALMQAILTRRKALFLFRRDKEQ
ncbi:MAG: DoxX family protein [Saprospiraceae bacterium]|nr:DoxX family protein [Saprospiraceae bacterium]